MRHRSLTAAALAAPLCLVLTAAVPLAAAADADPPVITVTTSEFEFDVPDQIPAGAVTLRLVNRGEEMHHIQVIRLKGGKTMEDFGKAMEAAMSPDAKGPPFPAWLDFLGGPNPPPPGGVAETTVMLRPGNYVFICFIPSADGVPHLVKGMVKYVRAVASQGAAELPAADVAVLLTDYDFNLSKPLKAGRNVLRVRNTASQPHELAIAKLNPGKTAEELLHWTETMQGPPPGMFVGGVSFIDGAAANNVIVDLTPGRYALLCFVPDQEDRRPHFMHGMVKEVTVGG